MALVVRASDPGVGDVVECCVAGGCGCAPPAAAAALAAQGHADVAQYVANGIVYARLGDGDTEAGVAAVARLAGSARTRSLTVVGDSAPAARRAIFAAVGGRPPGAALELECRGVTEELAALMRSDAGRSGVLLVLRGDDVRDYFRAEPPLPVPERIKACPGAVDGLVALADAMERGGGGGGGGGGVVELCVEAPAAGGSGAELLGAVGRVLARAGALRALDLSELGPLNEGARRAARGTAAEFDGDRLSENFLAPLIARSAASLERLRLCQCGFGGRGAAAVAGALRGCRALSAVTWRRQPCGAAGAAAVLDAVVAGGPGVDVAEVRGVWDEDGDEDADYCEDFDEGERALRARVAEYAGSL